MPGWCVFCWYSLRASARGLLRELVRGVWARRFVYPELAANEFDDGARARMVAQRIARLGLTLDPHAPLIDKAAVRADPARFRRPRRWGSLWRIPIRTSGTSGTPLTLVQSLGCVVREEAFVYRQLRWIGYRHGQRRAWIRGDIVCPARPRAPVYWCRDWVGKMLLMSSYHLSDATIGAYIAALERFDPVVLHAYPSSAAALARWLLGQGRRYRGTALLGLLTSSETLTPDVRALLADAFGAPVFDWYGQAERVAAIGTCEHGSYHLLTDYSLTDILDTGELVGTSLNNAAMALRRYRTGDTVELGEPCACARVFPTLARVHGRADAIVTLPDGRRIGRLDRVFQHQRDLLEAQVRWCGAGGFVLRVVAGPGLDEAALLAAFRLRVPEVPVRIERVAAIARGANGKFPFVVIDDGPSCAAPGRVLMFGTSEAGRGGIAATVAVWREAGWFARDGVRYVPSHVAGTRVTKLAVLARACLALLCARPRPRIVHVHAASGASFARKAVLLALARGLGCQTVFHLHGGGFQQFARGRARWIRPTLERSSAVLALSGSWADWLRSYAPAARVHVLPNAVALPPLADPAQVEPGRILFLGRLCAQKGVFDLLDALALLPDAQLLLAGECDAAAIRKHATLRGVADRVELAGWLGPAARARALARAAVFCLPSHAEGLPLALLEAMAAGKPVVATSVGAIPEVLTGGAGVLVAPGDPPALAAALAGLLADPARRAALGASARATVQAHYSRERVGDQLAALYRSLEGAP